MAQVRQISMQDEQRLRDMADRLVAESPEQVRQISMQDKQRLRDLADTLVAESPELVQAFIDYKRDRSSGMVEIHFSNGGIAKVYAKVMKTYK